jgi:serine/threonine-protein kinase
LFLELLKQIPVDSTHHDAAEAREWYAGCLAAEGRAEEAVPLLEAAERLYQSTYLYDFELPRVRATLGDAYDRLGRTEDARRMLKAALDQRVATNPADYQPVLAIRERWGRFLLSQGDIEGAEAQFREVLKQAHDRKLAHVALAYGGLARVQLARGQVSEAVEASRRAIDGFAHVTGFRDVRMGPQLWLVQSEVLQRSGDLAGARAWAQRALEARRRYDHPAAPSIREAETAVRALTRS